MDADSTSSDLTSLASFVTANDLAVNKSTAASSPTQDKTCRYRDARRLPRELKEHCQIFLEEQLYICAIDLLNSVVCAGASNRSPASKPVPVPPPTHLALLNTLIVHPLHTTRAEKSEYLDVSSQALGYLRNLLAIVGPVNADLKTAFQFQEVSRGGRRWAHHGRGNDSDPYDEDLSGDEDRLRGQIANESGLWGRGQDFWSTVGWALNCSNLYPHRWRYWRVWLEYMLDVLEADWGERERRDQEAYQASNKAADVPQTSRKESMILAYMENCNSRRNDFKGMLKALFADGGEISSAAYREVFEKEPRGPRTQSRKRKREQVLDLENDKFGDYFDDESMSSGISEPPTPQKPKDTRKVGSAGAYTPGMVESIEIRLRLFKLLSAVTFAMFSRRELDLLYEEFAAGIKLLPLPMFSLFVTQRPNILLNETHVTITRELFDLLLPSSYKKPIKVDPESAAQGCLTSLILEQCYICYPANTVAMEDNAKLSLVVENAIQILWQSEIQYSDSFLSAAEKGITAREAKAKKRRTGKVKGHASDVLAQDVLTRSAERIRTMLRVLECCDETEIW